MQDLVHEVFQRTGRLWECDRILLKLAEEVGELVREFRKGTREGQQHEFGDVLFTILALAEREQFWVERELVSAIARFEDFCKGLTEQEKRLKQEDKPKQVHSTTYGEFERLQAGESPETPQPSLDERDKRHIENNYSRKCQLCHNRIHDRNTTGLCTDCYVKQKALLQTPVNKLVPLKG